MKHSNAGVRYDVDGSIIRSGLQDKKVWNLREIVRACNIMAGSATQTIVSDFSSV